MPLFVSLQLTHVHYYCLCLVVVVDDDDNKLKKNSGKEAAASLLEIFLLNLLFPRKKFQFKKGKHF